MQVKYDIYLGAQEESLHSRSVLSEVQQPALPGSLLEKQILGPIPDLLKRNLWEQGQESV